MDSVKNILFKQVENRIKQFKSICTKALQTVVEQDVSLYPVLVAHRPDVILGIPLLSATQIGDDFALRVSTLEELVTKQIVSTEHLPTFQKLYRQHSKRFCVLVIDDQSADFVFIKSE
jgi:hypothetical protein